MSRWPVELSFPWDLYISANERLVPRGDRLVSSPEYRSRMEAARLFVRNQVSRSPTTGPVRMRQDIYPPDARRRDVRNVGKLFEDAAESVVYEDDAQIKDLRMVYHEPDRENPRIEVTVQPTTDPGA